MKIAGTRGVAGLQWSGTLRGRGFQKTCTLCSAVAYCCGAVAPCAIAALLGRFLPRLGPLASLRSGPFFFLTVEDVTRERERAGVRSRATQDESGRGGALFRGG